MKQQEQIPEANDEAKSDSNADDDQYDDAVYDESAPFVPQHVPNESVPLSDQAAVEHEANQWALLWREIAEYIPPEFAINDQMLKHMFPMAIRIAAKTFPANTGLGHDHIPPRGFLRLSDETICAAAEVRRRLPSHRALPDRNSPLDALAYFHCRGMGSL